MTTKMKDKGQADLAITIASTAIMIIVVVLVLGQLLPIGGTSVGGQNSTGYAANAAAYAAWSNVSAYTWTGVQLGAIGLIIVAGFGIIGLMMFRH
jgi:hypothetical protein